MRGGGLTAALALLLARTARPIRPVGLSFGRGARARSPHAAADELQPVEPAALVADLSGAVVNEEERVSVSYSGSAASRERRVRRTRRPNKEERWQRSSEPAGYRRMSAFCTVDSIHLEDALALLTTFSSYGERLSITSYTDVLHCRFFVDGSSSPASILRDAFLFPYGSVVLWGFTSEQEIDFLSDLLPCCEPISVIGTNDAGRSGTTTMPSLDDELGDSEFMLYEDMLSSHQRGDGEKDEDLGVSLSNNVIRLGSSEQYRVEKRLAVSFAFAQSAKLAVFEAALEATSEEVRPIPVQLAARGRCKVTVNEVARLTGRVFLERNAVNLYSNILDTPEFFWEAEEFEPLYRRVNRYLDIEDRVRILNKRLDIVNDLLDSLSTQLEVRNAHRLEVIIIYLIALEILLEVAKEVSLPALGLTLAAWPRRVAMAAWRALAARLGGG